MLRFRLRTFLIAITAFCLLLGWRVAAVESVERPIRELERLGWEVTPDLHIVVTVSTEWGSALVSRDNSVRNYWQKLFLGYRRNDSPTYAQFPRLNGPHSADLRAIEAGSLEWCHRSVGMLNRLPTVHDVSVWSPDLSAENLAPIAELEHVRQLDLSDCPIGDDGLKKLVALVYLEELVVWGTKGTKEGVQRLQEALPECEIYSDYD